MLTQMRRCRCCGAEVEHNGWLDPECVSRGSRDHARKKHLTVFRAETHYGVSFVCDPDHPDRLGDLDGPGKIALMSVYFGTEAQAKAFVERVSAGISKDEFAALVEAHKLPGMPLLVLH